MTAVAGRGETPARPLTVWHRLSAFFYRHPRAKVALLLSLPVAWFVVFYLGSLTALLWQSFYKLDDFTGQVDTSSLTLDTWQDLFTAANRDVVLRTMGMAAAVTVGAVVVAFPLAYFMARVARPRTKTVLFVAVLLPLWSSYLVRVYSWKLILAKEGVLPWFLDLFGLGAVLDRILELPVIGGSSLAVSSLGQWMVFLYIWLPYMVLPVEAALERVPNSFVEASGDLGARPRFTFRRVTWPLAFPGVVAGSIFTFSLTLGDYIIPTIIGNSSPSIGGNIYVLQGTAGNLPLAAAFAVVPILIMGVYLLVARRFGALGAL